MLFGTYLKRQVYQCQSLMFTKQKTNVEHALNQLMDIYNDKKDKGASPDREPPSCDPGAPASSDRGITKKSHPKTHATYSPA